MRVNRVFFISVTFLAILTSLYPVQASEIVSPADSLSQAQSHVDNASGSTGITLSREYWLSYVTDTESLIRSPYDWEKSDWIEASLIAGITAGLFTLDQEIQNLAQRNRSSTGDEIAGFFELFGNGLYTLPSLTLFYLYGHLHEDGRAQRTALLSVESMVFSTLFTYLLKSSLHRHRPESGDSFNEWDGPGLSASNLSFPSQHASSAFAVATVVASEYDDTPYIGPLAYSIATLTAISRVNDNLHWASDVFAGSAIGWYTAKKILSLHKGKGGEKLLFLPVIERKYAGLLLSYKF